MKESKTRAGAQLGWISAPMEYIPKKACETKNDDKSWLFLRILRRSLTSPACIPRMTRWMPSLSHAWAALLVGYTTKTLSFAAQNKTTISFFAPISRGATTHYWITLV